MVKECKLWVIKVIMKVSLQMDGDKAMDFKR